MLNRALLHAACALVLLSCGLAARAPQSVTPASAAPPAAGAASAVQPPLAWTDAALQQETYAAPPKELADAVLAPRYRNVALSNASPDKKWFAEEIGDGPVPMAVFAKPFHELGGVFVDFQANRARSLTIRNSAGLQIISAADGARRPVQLPAGVRVSHPTWAPDSSVVGFYVHTPDATHIWVADPVTCAARQATPAPVLATLASGFDFSADGKKLAAILVPAGRPPMMAPPAAPAGPQVRRAEEKDANRLRTFASLMATPYELALFEWHATGQVAVIDVQPPAAGAARARRPRGAPVPGFVTVGAPAMVRSLDLAPDAKYLRVSRLVKPFSYIVPVANFGSVDEVWDLSGKVLAQLATRPLDEGVQDATSPQPDPGAGPDAADARQQGRREIAWRADGQGLTFLEQDAPAADAAKDGAAAPPPTKGGRGGRAGSESGEGGPGARRPDRLFQWLPPFDQASLKPLFEHSARMSNHRFSPDHQVLFFSERSGRTTVEYAVYLNEPEKRYVLARTRQDDVYSNPGTIVMARGGAGGGRGGAGGPGGRGGAGGPGGGVVQLSADGASVFFQGTLYDKQPEEVGPKTFIDRVAIKTGARTRLYESDNNGVFERVTTPLDIEAGRFIVSREGPADVAQYYRVDGGTRTRLTANEDVTPDLTRAPRERITVTRADGFSFKARLTLPPGYPAGTRLPAIFWFYPREYASQEEYDRGNQTYNKNEAPVFGTRSMQFFVRLGYAVVEPDAPIVGPSGRMNDHYEDNLRNGLSAVIDELDRRGYIDRDRLAIGGHSYGAFSAVNAMAHTPFFKAGIAGDGAYNRTLTPLGFQSERRDLWQAKDTYLSMSPFLHANHLTGALLLYHGLGDQNDGTDPINSLRLFHALNGLGKTVALYMYPLEDHGPATRETLLDLWARWNAWLDKYVKNPKP
ncbi:MAG TPA: prolyl oligopeptidase family serine peptidase [Vicinamibacterales bacterium]|nr:prolyl oligopeptidase family serine peptidase [Vicinamibacterales bacterium]